jgi:uncharacterized membrane protein
VRQMARAGFLWAMLLVYATGRICQLYADSLPALLIVFLHVVPPALFAIGHGASLYGKKGISIFVLFCLGFGTLFESIALRTGIPFGSYYFTDVMGPKVFQLPVLLALAYLGIGYVAWVLALLIHRGRAGIWLPILASLIMTAWDLAMEPDWSTLDHAWIWQAGGPYFGVPLSNFCGWLLTTYSFYQAFALYCRARPVPPLHSQQRFYLPAILMYAVCAMGNLFILKLPMAPPVVADATGKQWFTSNILICCVSVSLLVMTPFALLAWLQVRRPDAL